MKILSPPGEVIWKGDFFLVARIPLPDGPEVVKLSPKRGTR